MTSHDARHAHSLPAGHPQGWASLAKRVVRMACLWGLFGMLVSLATLSALPSPVEVIARMIAGVIVLLPLGVFLGLIGGQFGPTLFGGVCGAGLGVLAAVLARTPSAAGVVLLGGALAGATLHIASPVTLLLQRAVTLAVRSREGFHAGIRP